MSGFKNLLGLILINLLDIKPFILLVFLVFLVSETFHLLVNLHNDQELLTEHKAIKTPYANLIQIIFFIANQILDIEDDRCTTY